MADVRRFPEGSQRIKVLVVDDDEHMRATLQRMLRRDADVTTAASAEEALAQIGCGDYDAILCDLGICERAGQHLLQLVRDQVPAAADRMLFMTGGALTEEEDAFLDAMASRTLAKPFNRTELMTVLKRLMRGDEPGPAT